MKLKSIQHQYSDGKGMYLFVAFDQINKELERLENLRILSKVDYSKWFSVNVYVKKKNYKIRVCTDFATWLNDSLHNNNYPLPNPEEISTKLNNGNLLSDVYLQILVEYFLNY